jgi:hypothetical protein
MAVLGGSVLTLADWAKRLDKDGKTPDIAEMLNQTNAILDDMLFKEGNLPTGERTTIRTGLPSVYWRLLNMGIPSSKSTTAQVDEQAGMLEAWSEVDKDLAELNGNANGFRLSEAQAFIEGMNQKMSTTLWYGNQGINPEEFNGLAVRYSSLSAANAQNIIDAGGTGSDNTSIWLIVWGPQSVHGIFPKGSKAGLVHDDLGLVTVETTAGIAGNRMRAYQDRWQWKNGLVVRDWRFAVRIANIDVSDLVANAGSQAKVINLMVKAMHRIPNIAMGRPVFYMNRTAREMLDIQEMASVGTGGGITFENVAGKAVEQFRGVPVRISDTILATEARVT